MLKWCAKCNQNRRKIVARDASERTKVALQQLRGVQAEDED
jgi:hypothetical protein